MKQKPLYLGGTYYNKKEAKAHAQAIVAASSDGHVLTGENHSFMLDLVDHHPEAPEKIGTGVERFVIRFIPPWKGLHVIIIRTDGSETAFSWNKSISNRTKWADFAAAARFTVMDQIIAFRKKAFSGGGLVRCPVHGDIILPDTCHVDHEYPNTFTAILQEFIGTSDWTAVQIVDALGGIGKAFGDAEYAARFAEFHRQRAVLRVVSIRANKEDRRWEEQQAAR
jgi:Protein of unknown function (DUF3223)